MPTDEPNLDFAALSLDSNILRGQRYNFDGGILKQLEQFSGSPVQIIQPDVIHFEGVSHLATEIGEALNAARSSLRTLAKYMGGDETRSFVRKSLGPNVVARNLAEQKLQDFYRRVNGNVISSATIDPGTLIKMYFSCLPPFEKALDKKHEFPDAIALLALKDWATANNKKIVLVSKDKGWHDFAATSELLKIVDDVSEALTLFQPYTKVKSLIAMLQSEGLLEAGSKLFQIITDAIRSNASSQEPTPYANSNFSFTWDSVETEYVDHKLQRQVVDSKPKVSIVRIKDNRVVLSLTCLVNVQLSVSFEYSQYDSTDNSYVALGTSVEKRDAAYLADVLIHFEGDWESIDGDLTPSGIEVVGDLRGYDFREIEPDFSRDHDEIMSWQFEWGLEQENHLKDEPKLQD